MEDRSAGQLLTLQVIFYTPCDVKPGSCLAFNAWYFRENPSQTEEHYHCTVVIVFDLLLSIHVTSPCIVGGASVRTGIIGLGAGFGAGSAYADSQREVSCPLKIAR